MVAILKDELVVARPFMSVAFTVNVKVLAEPLIVPEINPEEDNESPGGKEPEAIVYVGASPESSVADNCTEYDEPILPLDKAPEVTQTGARGPLITF